MTTPNPNRLPEDEQDRFYETMMSSPQAMAQQAITQAMLNGIIDPINIIHYRQHQKAFKTVDPDTQHQKEKAIVLAGRDEPVMITGESGTGKELLARILHGERCGEFVAVNVCAVTDTLFESELFGHVRGAFTGADRDRNGLIRQADGGTLFLDEIGDMPLQLQTKLLRVLQNRMFRRVGSSVDEMVKCRIVAATHRDLRKMIVDGTFRLDLYERLNVFILRLTPLLLRQCDLELHVGKEFADKLLQIAGYDSGGVSRLMLSGNVRQLLNLKLRHDVFGDKEITGEDIL